MSSSKKNNNMMGISFVDLTGQTEDTSNMPVGVSNRFETEDFKEMTRRRLASHNASVPASETDDNSPEALSSIQETTAKTDKILTDITGSTGTYKVLPLSCLKNTKDDWNRFTPISNQKKVLMADSIYRNGLQQPLVVRSLDKEGKQYEILAGNTRKDIYEVLHEITGDDKYLSIECKVYGYNELTDDQAREIASDTNYVQRANLTGSDKSFAVHTKLTILKKRGEKQILDKAAEQMGMKRTTAFYWNKMANLIPAFFDMYDSGAITQKVASRIASWTQEVQEELYMESENLTDEVIMGIPAKTPSDRVMDVFHELITKNQEEQAESRRIGHIKSLNENEDGYTINLSGKAPAASQLVIMYIPDKKATAFKNKYKDYILDSSDDSE